MHILGMIMLPRMHPDINRYFEEGRFSISKTGKRLSNIGIVLYLFAGPKVTNQVLFFQNLIFPAAYS